MRPQIAEMMSGMLERVVSDGTGGAAKVPGYSCAGKTGTAQKADLVNGGYCRGKYIAVFAGFVPANDPVATIVVMADSPKGKYYGGSVSAPAFKKIAQGILNYLEIPPTKPEEQLPREPEKDSWKSQRIAEKKVDEEPSVSGNAYDEEAPHMPDVRGMTIRSVIASLAAYSLDFQFEGSGIAISQFPAPGEAIDNGMPCRVEFKRKDA
jgi:membrane peptidoglycan carboxypeptidase